MVSQAAFDGPLSYRRCVLLLTIVCLGVSSLVSADEPRPQPAAKPLAAEQQKRLKERDRWADEMRNLWNAGMQAEASGRLQT